MKTMDPRIARRRGEVSEDRARGRLRWLLRFLVIALLIAGVAWLLRSPLLSIREVVTTGAVQSDPTAIAVDAGVTIGVPTISVRTGIVREALLEDPWIADATVFVAWPGRIEIDVQERVPAVAIETTEGWLAVAGDGTVLDIVTDDPGLVQVVFAVPDPVAPGTRIDDAAMRGALTFAAAFPSGEDPLVVVAGDDGLWAKFRGHDVRLGRPAEMEEKALALTALLDNGIADGAHIDL
ncbi:MAG: FtsQ-type POTRA domain-containing protein, partial [Actinomycetota bacterium]|nr:FtsQ-type POTRA domain-containing protein [Actinomycetota bacterium]